jgi:hypothetical protein
VKTLSASMTARHSKFVWWSLVGIVGIAFALHAAGIRKNLPYTEEMDEETFVSRAIRVATSGNLNPGWFGHPGSTVIYPLAGVYHIWHWVAHGGNLTQPDPDLLTRFIAAPAEFYLLGRLLTISYSVLSIPFTYRIGRHAFGRRTGLTGAWFSALSLLPVIYAQRVRTDSAALFFTSLSLWLCLRLYKHSTTRNHVWAGIAIGLGISSRYFCLALIPVLLGTNLLIMWERLSKPSNIRVNWVGTMAGLVAVIAGFAASTPYFLLDLGTAWGNLTTEARSSHLGGDGLPPWGNALWYVTRAIPFSMTWPLAILAAIGVILIVWRRRPQQMLLLFFAATFLFGISISSLHWSRWIIQTLPLLALFAAHAIDSMILYLLARVRPTETIQTILRVSIVLLVSAWPTYQLIMHDIREAAISTRVLAREWIIENLPPGSQLVQEEYAAPLDGTDFVVLFSFSLAERPSLDAYRADGYHYLVASSWVYDRYLAEPERYAQETAFYQILFDEGKLLQRFEPSPVRGGPVLLIYDID